MKRAITDHPILLGLPLGAAATESAHLLLGFNWLLASLAGLFAFAFVLFLCAVINRKRERALSESRHKGLSARITSLEEQLLALKSRFDEIATTNEAKAAQRNARLVQEMKLLEGLVQELATGQARNNEAAAAAAETALPETAAAAESDEPTARSIAELSEPELLEVIQSALEENRIDLYLRPIVSLPQRKVARYEGLARLRSLDGEVIEPAQYESVAAAAGFMPIIDNLLLFRCVQIVRKLMARNNRRPIFVRISSHSLLDSDYFPQFLEFMNENKTLKDLLVFEFARETLELAGSEGEQNLASLAALGFGFALSGIEDFKLDLSWLRRQGFRFAKLPARLLRTGAEDPARDIEIDNFLLRLKRQTIELIADEIEDESAVLDIVERDIGWGEGQLFGQPRPIRRDLLIEEVRTEAA